MHPTTSWLTVLLVLIPAVLRAQTVDRHGAPSVACEPNGNFVVVWHSRGQDGADYAVIGQRFDSNGARRGSEFVVNTSTTAEQSNPAVCLDTQSSFVVAWQSDYQGIAAQIFDSVGQRRSPEFQVATDTSSSQGETAIDCGDNGSFVIAWNASGADGDDYGILGRRFSNFGSGSVFSVNTYTTNIQLGPSVGVLAGGDFVVVWTSYEHVDDLQEGVFGQRFASAGTKVGTEFRVNTYTADVQAAPAVAADANGGFVVAWSSQQDGDPGFGVFGQRFAADGTPEGGEFHINTQTEGDQGVSLNVGHVLDVATAGDDRFVVVWQSSSLTGPAPDGDGLGVFGQRFAGAPPAPVGSEFQVNTATAGDQAYPAVCATTSGEFVVAWETRGGEVDGILAQRYDANGASVGSEIRVNSNTARSESCPGDCDESFTVTVNELVRGVNIALDRAPLEACPLFDADGSLSVTVNELVTGVRAALEGCESLHTPTPQPTVTPRIDEERTRKPTQTPGDTRTQPPFTSTPRNDEPSFTPTPRNDEPRERTRKPTKTPNIKKERTPKPTKTPRVPEEAFYRSRHIL